MSAEAGAMPRGARLRSFHGIGLRSLRARPLRSVLTTGGIVLGVGMAFGVLVLVTTIHSSFEGLFDAIYGRTSVVVSGSNSIGSVPESELPKIRQVDGVKAAEGEVFGVFRTIDAKGAAESGRDSMLFVAGVDMNGYDTAGAEVIEGREPHGPREIELEESWAQQRGYGPGDRLRLATPTGRADVTVTGVYKLETNLDLGGYGTAAMPIDGQRRLTNKYGTFDEINVVAEDGVSAEALKRRIAAVTGPGVEVETPAGKGDQANESLAGLDIVLYFFSGIALFVGAFLILNSFNMTVLQRMREIGTMRALGASRRRLAGGVVFEALILAAVGAALGLALGLGLAELLASAMRNLFGLPISALKVTTGAAVIAIAVGLLATLAGSLYPALRAGRIPPIRALTGGRTIERPPGLRRALAGFALFLPGLAIGGLFWFSNQSGGTWSAVVGVGSTVVMFVGMVLLAPFVVMPLVRLLSVPARALMPAEGRLASDSVRANPLRSSATASALVVTLSVVVVNGIMSQSFVGSISDELDKRFSRDLTVQPVGYNEYGGGPGTNIARPLREKIAELPEAGTVTPVRSVYMLHLPVNDEPGLLEAVDPKAWPRVDKSEYEGVSTAQAMAGLARGGAIVGKGFADDTGVEVGDTIPLKGASGARRVPVVATVDTFEASGNQIVISLGTMRQVYGITADSVLALTAGSPQLRGQLETKVHRLLAVDYPGYEAVSNTEFKQHYEDAINQQFAFFNAIIGIAVIVGLLGIVNTLSMSVIERTREIGVLRALGGSRWRVRRAMLDESLLISLGGCLAGILAGLIVGLVWIYSVRASTLVGLNLHIPVGMLIMTAVLGVVIGTLAAILPARRAAHLDPLRALTYE
ncbi:MAG TPA: FtsX-like permease family protein [Solirubrobacterales bacterium]|nr:FtsX-like permease family protein [Solirubrobacterales bacterium]